MKNPVWSKAVKNSADPQRAVHFVGLLGATSAARALETASPEQARILCAVFSGSHALSAWLAANPDVVPSLAPELLAHPRRKQGLHLEVTGLAAGFARRARLCRRLCAPSPVQTAGNVCASPRATSRAWETSAKSRVNCPISPMFASTPSGRFASGSLSNALAGHTIRTRRATGSQQLLRVRHWASSADRS